MGKTLEFINNKSKPKASSIIEGLSSLDSFGAGARGGKGKIKLENDSKKKKKDKKKKGDSSEKKKKKKSNLDFDFDLISEEKVDADGQVTSDILIDIDIDVDSIAARFEDDGSNPIVNKEKNKYEKRRKDKNPFKKEFAEETTLLYGLYDEVGQVVKNLEKIIKQSDGSRVRGQSKYYNEAVSNLLNAKNSQLSIVKELNNVKKTIQDLKMKDEAAKRKEGGDGNNMSHAAASFLQQTLQMPGGRNQFLQAARGTSRPAFLVDSYTSKPVEEYDEESDPDAEEEEEDEDVKSYKRQNLLDLKENVPGYTSDEIDNINQAIAERLEREDNGMRSAKGNKFIEYEKRGVEIKIRRDLDTGEFDFIAVDRDNQVVHDYPLPENYGKVKFNGPVATDRYGESYKVIEYSSSGNPMY